MNQNTKLSDIGNVQNMSIAQIFTLAAQAQARPNERAELEAHRAQQPRESERQELLRLRAQDRQREALQVAQLAASARAEARAWVRSSGGK
jgi:hypothetical protein